MEKKVLFSPRGKPVLQRHSLVRNLVLKPYGNSIDDIPRRNFQRRGAFIAPFPKEENIVPCLKVLRTIGEKFQICS
jgi:hypothetical protein